MSPASVCSLLIVLSIVFTSGLQNPSCQRKEISLGNVKIEAVDNKKVVLRVLDKTGEVILKGNLGLDLPEVGISDPVFCPDELCLEWGTLAKVSLRADGEYCTDITW